MGGKLTRFWRALEALTGPAAVAAQWEALLGPEHDLAAPLLRRTGRLAASFPRLPPERPGPPYRVVEHGPDDFVLVCPKSDGVRPVGRADLLLHEVDRRALGETVAAALGLERNPGAAVPPGRAWRIGDHVGRPGERLPVYLALPLGPEDLGGVALQLLAVGQEAFLLLAPTRRWLVPATEAALRAGGARFLALEEVLVATPGELQAVEPLAVVLARLRRPAAGGEPGADENVFRREDDRWAVRFDKKAVRLKHAVGVTYLAHLIAHKGRTVHAAVVKAVAAKEAPRRVDGGDRALDEPAIASYRKRYEDLRLQLEEAEEDNDPAKHERAQLEIDALTRELKAAKGVGGKARKLGGEADKVRKAVSNGIARAIEAVRAKHAALALHLDNAVHTGQFMRYSPHPDIDWVT